DDDIERYAQIFRAVGGAVYYVELQASQSVRLERDQTPFRLQQKPTKRDAEVSRQRLRDMDANYQLDSGDRFAGRDDYLKIDNTARSAAEVAEMVLARFKLPLSAPAT